MRSSRTSMGLKSLTRSISSVPWTTYFDMNSQRGNEGGVEMQTFVTNRSIIILSLGWLNDHACCIFFVLLRSLLRDSF